jgi:hypothetical protein
MLNYIHIKPIVNSIRKSTLIFLMCFLLRNLKLGNILSNYFLFVIEYIIRNVKENQKGVELRRRN